MAIVGVSRASQKGTAVASDTTSGVSRASLVGVSRATPTTPVASQTTVKKQSPQTQKINAELKQIVADKGLQSKLPTVGEDPNKIFSGGWITDTFDALSVLQYGVSGVLKGKSFSEGVKTRQSFSDKDALGAMGIPGVVAGIIADIAVDPFTYVPIANVFTIGRKIPVLKSVFGIADKGATKAKDLILKTEKGKQLANAFIYRFGQDPVYKKMATRQEVNKARQVQNVVDIVRPITKLDGATQKRIAEARKQGLLADFTLAEKNTKVTPTVKTDFGKIDVDGSLRSKLSLNEGARKEYEQIIGEMDMAEAGKRFQTDDFDLMSVSSTFPKWVPKHLRDKDLFQSVMQKVDNVDTLVTPQGKREGELFDSMLDEWSNRSGIDVNDIRTDLKALREGTYKPKTPDVLAKAPLDETQKYMNAEDFLGKDVLDKALPVFERLDQLGNEAVELGLLPREVWEENVGTYMARLYAKHEKVGDTVKGFMDRTKPQRMDLTRFMKRDDIPEDIREAMGEILEAGYPTAKSLVQLTAAVENAKFFKNVAATFGRDVADVGLKKLPNTKALGELAGKYVPEAIFGDIDEIISTKKYWGQEVVAAFKFSKVILNPATHIRNILSNFILNYFEGLPPGHPAYFDSAKELVTKGKYYKEAEEVGLGVNTFAASEIRNWLDPKGGILNKINAKTKGFLEKAANLYEKEEQFAKLSQFIYQRKYLGKSADEAWQIAERATFNYAQVTPFIRTMRSSIFGYPFVTFTYKATPQVLRTAYHHTSRITNIGRIKNAIENQIDDKELERERATEPDWVRNGFYVALPIKDEKGRRAYLDLTYIMPFGDMLSGNIFTREIERETGLPEHPIKTAANKLPLVNMITELSRNQDFYGNKIYKDSDPPERQLGDLMRYLVKTMAPPVVSDQIAGGYRNDGTQREGTFMTVGMDGIQKGRVSGTPGMDAGGAQDRTALQELMRMAALKTTPVDIDMQEDFAARAEQRAIRTILEEEGDIGIMELPYKKKKDEEEE